jgi:hypothetical protein
MFWVASMHFLDGDVIGLLGEDFFENFDLDIDLKNNSFGLFQHADCATEPIYWSTTFSEADAMAIQEQILVTVALDGTETRALLDTGASRTLVSWALAHRLGLDQHSPGMEISGRAWGLDQHPMDQYRYRFSELKVGDEVIRNPILRVTDVFHRQHDWSSADKIQDNHTADPDIILGSDFIRSHHIYFATRQRKLYFTWNGGSIFLAPKDDPAATAGTR